MLTFQKAKAIIPTMQQKDKERPLTYADSGVDIKAGERTVDKIKDLAAATFNSQVLTGIGAFGGLFQPDFSNLKEPVLVSSTDSVGTKVKLAFMTGKHDTIGEDLVNHCVNDILVHAARPLFFLDYIGAGKVDPDAIAELVSGVSRGCKNTGMPLIGGETAEMPDMYKPKEYDLAGFVVGVVEKEKIVNGSTIKDGDVCLGLPSNGLHTNGYTLARKVAFEIAKLKPNDQVESLGMSIAESLMKVHRCYASIIHPLLEKYDIHGMAHITGGGIAGNLIRILPENICAEIKKDSWPSLPIFDYLKSAGNLDPDDIYSSFNMGIGYIIVVSEDIASSVSNSIKEMGEAVFEIGQIKKGPRAVRLL